MSSYSDFANAASDILLKKGDALAGGKRASGELWGSTIATLGDAIPKQVQAVLKDRAQKQKTAQIQNIIQQNGGDLDKSIPMIMGIDPTLGQKLAKDHADVQKSVAEAQKLKQDAAKADLDFSDRLWGQVQDEDSYARAALVSHALGENVPPQYDPAWVLNKKKSLQSIKDQLAPAPEKKLYPLTPGMKLANEEGTFIAENPYQLTPDQQADNARQESARLAAEKARTESEARMTEAQKETARHNRATEARLGAQAAAANAPPIEIKPGSPEYQVAKDLASGKLTMLDFQRLYGRAEKNAGLRQGIYYQARQFNPDFEPAQFELGFKMAGNPQIRQRVVAINALDPVIDRIEALVDQSGNTGLPGFNKLLNSAKFQLGNRTVTDMRQLQTLLGDEIGIALGVGTGSDLKTKLGIDMVNPNLSPANFRDTMEQARTILGQRRGELVKTMGVYGGAADSASGGPKVGDIKTFPNGNKGRWDGKGWELVK